MIPKWNPKTKTHIKEFELRIRYISFGTSRPLNRVWTPWDIRSTRMTIYHSMSVSIYKLITLAWWKVEYVKGDIKIVRFTAERVAKKNSIEIRKPVILISHHSPHHWSGCESWWGYIKKQSWIGLHQDLLNLTWKPTKQIKQSDTWVYDFVRKTSEPVLTLQETNPVMTIPNDQSHCVFVDCENPILHQDLPHNPTLNILKLSVAPKNSTFNSYPLQDIQATKTNLHQLSSYFLNFDTKERKACARTLELSDVDQQLVSMVPLL